MANLILKHSKISLVRTCKMSSPPDFLKFIDNSPSPYHAVNEIKSMLVNDGFTQLLEKSQWNLSPNKKYFVTNNFSSIIAFAVGGKFTPGNGFAIVGAHTDSPCLKVKPKNSIVSAGYNLVKCECYGGGIWPSWFDRDLKIAGRVIIKENDKLKHRLVQLDNLLRIPLLAIHLDRGIYDKFEFNKETNLVPVLGLEGEMVDSVKKLVSVALSVSEESVYDMDLVLADAQPSALGGTRKELIFAPRLDNLATCFCSVKGFVSSCGSLAGDSTIRMVALFDNEEVGSDSVQGAGSRLLESIMKRICHSFGSNSSPVALEETLSKSFLVSADMVHGVHPNYSEKHEALHRPGLNAGIVIKYNANQRYATTAITAAIAREVAMMAQVPCSEIVVRNDSPCGSTIGPILSTGLGVKTVDLGVPQLSMHSIREMCATDSIEIYYKFFKTFYEHYSTIDVEVE